ncbi:MAG: DUF3108 domain-containing protein [Steroidobacteraceae bacterium]
MRPFASGLLASLLAAQSPAPQAADAGLQPYVAEYEVRYGNMTVGRSRTELDRAGQTGHWVIESQSTASGFARLIAGGTLKQRSTFELSGASLRPTSYSFDDGTKRTARDVTLEFDWLAGRVRGVAEGEPVDVQSVPGLQDAASIQAFVQSRLANGEEPGTVPMIEKDRIKHYRHTLLRRERLATAIGEYDTVVYRSARDKSDREIVTWYAPALGFAAVQAEQRSDGKRAFQTYIRSYQPGR